MTISTPELQDLDGQHGTARTRRRSIAWWVGIALVGIALVVAGLVWGAIAGYGVWQVNRWHAASLKVGLVVHRVNDLYGQGSASWTTSSNGTTFAISPKGETVVIPNVGAATSHELVYDSFRVQYPRTFYVMAGTRADYAAQLGRQKLYSVTFPASWWTGN